MATLYDTDFYAWTQEQARKLRAGEPVDAAHIAEELETLGRTEKRELTKRLAVLLQHMLKWEHQPSMRTRSWEATIKEQRKQVNRVLAENPSLMPKLAECIADAYSTAVTFASVETGMLEEDFPAECPYSAEFILKG